MQPRSADARTRLMRGRTAPAGHMGAPQTNGLQTKAFPLDGFGIGALVLAKNVNRPQPFWPVSYGSRGSSSMPSCAGAGHERKTCHPLNGAGSAQAIVVSPEDAPESVRRIMQPGKLCIMFYGPALNKVGTLLWLAYACHLARADSGPGRPSFHARAASSRLLVAEAPLLAFLAGRCHRIAWDGSWSLFVQRCRSTHSTAPGCCSSPGLSCLPASC